MYGALLAAALWGTWACITLHVDPVPVVVSFGSLTLYLDGGK